MLHGIKNIILIILFAVALKKPLRISKIYVQCILTCTKLLHTILRKLWGGEIKGSKIKASYGKNHVDRLEESKLQNC